MEGSIIEMQQAADTIKTAILQSQARALRAVKRSNYPCITESVAMCRKIQEPIGELVLLIVSANF